MLISTNSGLHSARPGKPRYPMAEAIDFFADAGFEAVDLNFAATIYPEPLRHEPILDGDWKANLAPVMERIRERKLVVSHSHVPFFDYRDRDNPAYGDWCRGIRLAIQAAAYCGAPWTVIHCARHRDGHDLVAETVEDLKPYLEWAEIFGIGLAVENNFYATADDMLEIVHRLNSPLVGVCWDIGHANKEPYTDPAESIMKLGKTLKVTHLHDNYGTKDNHNVPYFGTIDWDAVTRALLTSGYEGTFNYEANISKVSEAGRMDLVRYMVAVARDLLQRNGAGLS